MYVYMYVCIDYKKSKLYKQFIYTHKNINDSVAMDGLSEKFLPSIISFMWLPFLHRGLLEELIFIETF